MLASAIVITALACLVGLVWTSRHLLIRRELRNGFSLTEDYPGPPADAPFLSVLVAAKDRPRYRMLKTVPLDLGALQDTTTVERRVQLPDDVQAPGGAPLTVMVTAVVVRPSAAANRAADEP